MVVDGLAFRVDGKRIGEDQRNAAARRGMVHRDGDDSAEREAADVPALDSKPVHRGQDG
jgi:hypothetical protein